MTLTLTVLELSHEVYEHVTIVTLTLTVLELSHEVYEHVTIVTLTCQLFVFHYQRHKRE